MDEVATGDAPRGAQQQPGSECDTGGGQLGFHLRRGKTQSLRRGLLAGLADGPGRGISIHVNPSLSQPLRMGEFGGQCSGGVRCGVAWRGVVGFVFRILRGFRLMGEFRLRHQLAQHGVGEGYGRALAALLYQLNALMHGGVGRYARKAQQLAGGQAQGGEHLRIQPREFLRGVARDSRVEHRLPAQGGHHQLVGERAVLARELLHGGRVQQLAGVGRVALDAQENGLSLTPRGRDGRALVGLGRGVRGRRRNFLWGVHVIRQGARQVWVGSR